MLIGKTCNYSENLKSEKCHKHKPEPITKAKDSTILSDFSIQIDRKIKSNRSYTVVKDLYQKEFQTII